MENPGVAVDVIQRNPELFQYLNLFVSSALVWFVKRYIRQQDESNKRLAEELASVRKICILEIDALRRGELLSLEKEMAILRSLDIGGKLQTMGEKVAVLIDRDRRERLEDLRREAEGV